MISKISNSNYNSSFYGLKNIGAKRVSRTVINVNKMQPKGITGAPARFAVNDSPFEAGLLSMPNTTTAACNGQLIEDLSQSVGINSACPGISQMGLWLVTSTVLRNMS